MERFVFGLVMRPLVPIMNGILVSHVVYLPILLLMSFTVNFGSKCIPYEIAFNPSTSTFGVAGK